MRCMNSIFLIRTKRLGVTQAAMAEALAVTQGNISNYERGQTMPPDVARRLIVYAAERDVRITYEDIYGAVETGMAPMGRRRDDPKLQ